MRINLIAIGQNMPSWIQQGFETYAKRLPKTCSLNLIEIAPAKRHRNYNATQIKTREGKKILATISPKQYTIALTESGQLYNTHVLAKQLQRWQTNGRDVNLLIGGPDGLSPDCLSASASQWSLSPLTLPHMLVRVIVAEQLYRAVSLLTHHPYHRDFQSRT